MKKLKLLKIKKIIKQCVEELGDTQSQDTITRRILSERAVYDIRDVLDCESKEELL